MSESEIDVAAMRRAYGAGELRREDLAPDPIQQFGRWLEDACRAKIIEPNAMSLATVDSHGQPTLRTVLLKQFDAKGFVFYTNLESRKARQIRANPRVALLFPWLMLERQVKITGVAERLPTAEAIRYFLSRPRDSQLAAWASQQSSVISSRKVLEMAWDEVKRKFGAGEIPMPSFWGGYRVKPDTLEFWQGRGARLHDRFLYSRGQQDTWTIERLAP